MTMVHDRINSDLKQAMLAQDKPLVSILRSLKSAILYKEVEDGKRDEGLDEQAVIAVLKKEKKSRADSLGMYTDAGETARADLEAYQIGVIEQYLPETLSEEATATLVDEVVAELGIETVEMKNVGAIMKAAKEKNSAVEGGVVSKIIKDRISA